MQLVVDGQSIQRAVAEGRATEHDAIRVGRVLTDAHAVHGDLGELHVVVAHVLEEAHRIVEAMLELVTDRELVTIVVVQRLARR